MSRGEGDDKLVWRLTASSFFVVCYFYKQLSSPTTDAFPWEYKEMNWEGTQMAKCGRLGKTTML